MKLLGIRKSLSPLEILKAANISRTKKTRGSLLDVLRERRRRGETKKTRNSLLHFLRPG